MEEEKDVARVIEIVHKIDELKTELGELMGYKNAGEEEEEEEEQEPEKPAPKAPRKCGECNEIGHSKRKCPKLSAPKNVGSVEPAEESEPVKTGGMPMPRAKFQRTKEMQEQEIPSLDIAKGLLVNLQEVNVAFRSSTYEDYFKNRKNNPINSN